jgi:hypothetical protein
MPLNIHDAGGANDNFPVPKYAPKYESTPILNFISTKPAHRTRALTDGG